jgi:hypothetical protein
MARFYLIAGFLVLSLYSWGQYRGVGLFDDLASATPLRGNLARTAFHK